MSATLVKTKKRCCGDRPRCKKCPVVWKRLSKAGVAERDEDALRIYHVTGRLTKKQLKAARAKR
jgi:hypothetical protein